MEFHLPHVPIRSLKDFLIHLGIITLGILVALALEQLVAAHHRASLAAEAVAGFRRELDDNRRQVQDVMADLPRLRAQIQAAIAQVTAPPAGVLPPPLKYPDFHFNLLSSGSWETAVATQALNELPYNKAKGYVEAYGVFRLFLDEERAGLAVWQDMRVFGTDVSQLTPEQRRALIEQLHRYESFTYLIEKVGEGALKSCDEALR